MGENEFVDNITFIRPMVFMWVSIEMHWEAMHTASFRGFPNYLNSNRKIKWNLFSC
jgi:hypothetical protein